MPNRPLLRLFYRSRQTPSAAADLDRTVSRIITGSVARNGAAGITGLLLTAHGHFIQALEGEREAVMTAYARISRDPRHQDLHIISQDLAGARLFGDWNMCARALAASDRAILDLLDGQGAFNPRALTAASVERLLTTVAAIQRRTQAGPVVKIAV